MAYNPIADLRAFLAYSLEIERESAERLRDIARTMDGLQRHDLAQTFSELAGYSDRHAQQVAAILHSHQLPETAADRDECPDFTPPETLGDDRLNRSLTVRQALESMLTQERESAEFYTDVAVRTANPEIRHYALGFAAEEREHARALEARLHNLPRTD